APVDEITDCVFRDRLHERARATWHEIQAAEPAAYSKAYVQGFEAGFVDFIDRDGTGEPPAMPPPYLRRAVERSPAGQDAVKDWYAGFERGARAAQQTGLRGRAVVPIGLPPRYAGRSYAPTGAQPRLPPSLEQLPPPLQLPPMRPLDQRP